MVKGQPASNPKHRKHRGGRGGTQRPLQQGPLRLPGTAGSSVRARLPGAAPAPCPLRFGTLGLASRPGSALFAEEPSLSGRVPNPAAITCWGGGPSQRRPKAVLLAAWWGTAEARLCAGATADGLPEDPEGAAPRDSGLQ